MAFSCVFGRFLDIQVFIRRLYNESSHSSMIQNPSSLTESLVLLSPIHYERIIISLNKSISECWFFVLSVLIHSKRRDILKIKVTENGYLLYWLISLAGLWGVCTHKHEVILFLYGKMRRKGHAIHIDWLNILTCNEPNRLIKMNIILNYDWKVNTHWTALIKSSVASSPLCRA